MYEAQETMSGAASNYDIPRLILGTVLAFLVCILGFFLIPSLQQITPEGMYTSVTFTLYAVLMFASSYVEEEHNFWYWATSGWFALLFLSSMRKDWYDYWMFHPAIMTLVLHRVIRRWNQTGQKYAGADDIVNSGIFHGSGSVLLWALIGATYMDITIRLAKHVARSVATFETEVQAQNVERDATDQNRAVATVAVLPLCGTAFVFKLAFTAKDAPELTQGISGPTLDWIESANLVGLALMVFGGIALSGLWIAGAEWQRSNRRSKRGAQGNGGKVLRYHGFRKRILILSQILPSPYSTS